MKPETALFLAKAQELLKEADVVGTAGLPKAAGRSAYLAGFHAAQAWLFETTSKTFKTHQGVQSEFSRLTKADPRFSAETRAFLGDTYDLKSMADYVIDPGAKVSRAEADEAITAARAFVACLNAVLGQEP